MKLGEAMESEPQIVEPKTTYGLIDNSLKFAVVLVSLKNIQRPRPGDVINRGKISKKARKTPVFLVLDVFNQKM